MRRTLVPDSPDELLELAAQLDDHRRFVLGCGVTWPTLAEELARPNLVATVLESIRRSRAAVRARPARRA